MLFNGVNQIMMMVVAKKLRILIFLLVINGVNLAKAQVFGLNRKI